MAQLPEPEGVDATVVSHRWVELGRESKLALAVTYDVGGREIDGLIWFTEAAQNMGRRALMSLGFDITNRDPAELDEKDDLLKGAACKVKIVQQSYNGQIEDKADIVIPRNVAVGRGSLKALGERIKAPPKTAPKQQETFDEPFDPPAQPAVRTGPKSAEPKQDDINFDDIPFIWMLPFVVATLAVMA